MADPPRFPRPVQPPPLPPRPLVPEPFRVLTEEERAADTERTPRLPPRNEIPPPPDVPVDLLTETTAVLLRRELVLLRESLPSTGAPSPSVPPVSVRSRSRQALAGILGTTTAAGALAILTLLAGIAAKRWPAYAELIQGIAQALGAGGP